MSDTGKAVYVTIKPWWASRTAWVAILLFISAGLDALAGSPVLPEWADYFLMAKAMFDFTLRKITQQPIG